MKSVGQPSFIWSDRYCTGHEKTDREHKYLFDLLQRAVDAIHDDDQSYIVQQLLNNLIDYSQINFEDEEAVMSRFDIPGQVKHIAKHNELLQRTEDLIAKSKLGYSALLQKLISLLEDWIKEDVLEEDTKLANLLIAAN